MSVKPLEQYYTSSLLEFSSHLITYQVLEFYSESCSTQNKMVNSNPPDPSPRLQWDESGYAN